MINRIKNLIQYLPRKDIDIGYKLLENRDFENLQYLVTSALIKTNKNIKSSQPRKEYEEIDIRNLNLLKAEVDVYITQLDLPLINDIYGNKEFWID